MSWRRPCGTCEVAPVAFTQAPCCFACWPGGPVVPPPCLTCGSTVGYFTNGLCGRCHQFGPDRIGSCTDCYAWGATRHRGWRCIACDRWRQIKTLGTCACCGRSDLPLAPDGGCRLCRKQRSRVLATEPRLSPTPDLVEANRDGQQLYFADMFRPGNVGRRPCPPELERVPRQPTATRQRPLFTWPATPAFASPVDGHDLVVLPRAHRQEPLFAWRRDLTVGRRLGFPEPDERIAARLMDYAEDRGAEFGWSRHHIDAVRGALRILLAIQETPGARIRASEVKDLTQLGYSVPAVTAVLVDAGMFDDDREPAIVAWFASQTAELPDSMRAELGVWFDIMRNGSSTPPRRRARKDQTTASQLRIALPSLRHWATTHDSLREITNDHIRAALPASGSPRALRLQAFRSIFRILKARQLVFTNPTARFKARNPDHVAPVSVDPGDVRPDRRPRPSPIGARRAARLPRHPRHGPAPPSPYRPARRAAAHRRPDRAARCTRPRLRRRLRRAPPAVLAQHRQPAPVHQPAQRPLRHTGQHQLDQRHPRHARQPRAPPPHPRRSLRHRRRPATAHRPLRRVRRHRRPVRHLGPPGPRRRATNPLTDPV